MEKQPINHKTLKQSVKLKDKAGAFQNFLSKLPAQISGPSMVLQNGTILFFGGRRNYIDEKNCLQLEKGNWKEHSTLNMRRIGHSAVATQTAVFVFGGYYSCMTYEYLPKDSNKWLIGKTRIPGGFDGGCAIAAKSGKDIWLIGGSDCERRILKFNVNDHTFQSVPSHLKVKRREPRCAFLPNTNKIMITGGVRGFLVSRPEYLNSTEILDTEDGSIIMASPMNFKRYGHGVGVVTINGVDKLAVFGGIVGSEPEFYNTQSKEWEITNVISAVEKECFGFLTVKLADIIPHRDRKYVICATTSKTFSEKLLEDNVCEIL